MIDQVMDIACPRFVSWCSIGEHGEVCSYSPQELIIGSHGEVRGPLGTHPNDLDEDGIMLMDKTLNLEIYAKRGHTMAQIIHKAKWNRKRINYR